MMMARVHAIAARLLGGALAIGLLAAAVPAEATTLVAIDSPAASATVQQPFFVTGWTIDAASTTDTGVDAIHIWAYPNPGSGQAAVFVTAAAASDYGYARPDIAALYGSRFQPSGYRIVVRGLAPGLYTLVVYAHSSIDATWTTNTVNVTVTANPIMSLDTPLNGTDVSTPFAVGGWAIDWAAASGTGSGGLDLWAVPTNGSTAIPLQTLTPGAGYGTPRPDVGAAYGSAFTPSGFNFLVSNLAAGQYDLVAYMWSTVSGAFTLSQSARIQVHVPPPAPVISPAGGSFHSPQSVSMSIPAGTQVRFTRDGTTPTALSEQYTGGAVTLSVNTALRAVAMEPGYAPGPVASADFTFVPLDPSMSPAPGTFAQWQSVTLQTATAGANIYWTNDGTTPTAGSSLYTGPLYVAAATTVTIKAIAIRTGWTPSAVTSGTYTVTATPLASITGGGAMHALAVRADGTAWAWGSNSLAPRLGDNPPLTLRPNPVAVSGLTGVRALAGGNDHSLALMADGTVRGWGGNGFGQVGDGTTASRALPTTITGLSGIAAIDAGATYSVALASSGAVLTWGNNPEGQLGVNPTVAYRASPGAVSGLTSIQAIAAGRAHIVALRSDGSVWTWGANNFGQLGYSTSPQMLSYVPLQVPGLGSIVSIGTAGDSSFAVTIDGQVWAWGANASGQLGDGTVGGNRSTPMAMSNGASAVAIVGGSAHALILKRDGTVWAVGNNAFGQLGFNTASGAPASTPQQIPGLTGIARIGAGDSTSYAVAQDGSAWAWGLNAPGLIGDGTATVRGTPVPIAGAGLNWLPWIPVIGTPSGTYGVDQNPVITNADASAVMRYTVNGLDPTASDTTIAAGSSLAIGQSQTLKVRSFKSGVPPSEIAVANYTLKVMAPVMSPAGGSYGTAQTVTLSSNTASAVIHYTLDGSTPTSSSPIYAGAFVIPEVTVVRAIAMRSGWTTSDVSSVTYNVVQTVATPVITPITGEYSIPLQVTITSTPGAQIHYRLDGGVPSLSSTAYTGPFSIGDGGDAHLRAIAMKANWIDSAVASADYTVHVAAPVFSPGAGTYAASTPITVSTPTAGATITYTLDGSDPTLSSATIASGAPLIVGPYTLKAKAWLTGMSESAMTSATYTVSDDTVPMLTGGGSNVIALRTNGTAWAWGRNQFGAVGDGTTLARLVPSAVSAGGTVRVVSAGQESSLGLMLDRTVRGWGHNSRGEVGDGTFMQRTAPTLVSGLTDIVAIDSGYYHSVALRATGVVMTWGDNTFGQLGEGTTTNQSSPVTVPGLTNVRAISAGRGHTLALKTDGTVWAWGLNFEGELGDGTTATRTTPVQVSGLTSVIAIAAGWDSSYAVTSDGTAWAWGKNGLGQLGDGTTFSRTTPVVMGGISGAVAIAGGEDHAIVLKNDGTAWATGDNASGQLGFSTDSQTYAVVAQPIVGLSGVAHIGAGDRTSYAVAADGAAWAWGRNIFGVIGDGTGNDSAIPIAIAGPGLNWRPWIPVIGTPSMTYFVEQSAVITNADASAVMHYTVSGLDPTEADPTIAPGSAVPVGQSLTLKVRSFKAGAPPSEIAFAAYVLKVTAPTFSPPGGVYASAQSVTLSTVTTSAPIRFTTDGSAVATTSTAYSGSIPVDSPTTVRAVAIREGWTASDEASATYLLPAPGAIAPPTISPAAGTYATERVIAFAAPAGASVRYTLDGTDPTERSALFVRGFVLDRSATVKARAFKPWFLPSSVTTAVFTIQAPATTATPSISPAGGRFTTGRIVTISGPAGATLRYTTDGTDPATGSPAIASGGTVAVDRAMVVKVRAWQSGLAASVVRREDYVITGAIAAGSQFSMVLKADGSVWTWGANDSGQLGDGTLVNKPGVPATPVLTGAVGIAAGAGHALALKADGTVWAWGSNGAGQVGGTPFNNRPSPQQVLGLSDVIAIAASLEDSYALKSDGTVWAWGENDYGQIGDGTTGSKSTPTLVSGLGGVSSIAAGDKFAVAIVSHGAGAGHVWAWGANFEGQLGDGTTISRASPHPVAGTALVTSISAGGYRVGARTNGSELLLWGTGGLGQQANGGSSSATDFSNYVPTRAAPWVTPLILISGGENHALALDQMGRAWGWGDNSGCQLTAPCVGVPPCIQGSPCAAPHRTAEQILGLTNGAMLAGGQVHSLAVTQDGQVWSWGANNAGQLGTGDDTARKITPYAIPGLTVADNSWLTGDPDGDGLTTWREYELGTDPLSSDTDGDGIPDDADLAAGVSSTNVDPDGDGLTNAREAQLGTDPNNPDTDGDGVPDSIDYYPLDPTRSAPPPVDPNDHTPPVITLTYPSGARPVGGGGL